MRLFVQKVGTGILLLLVFCVAFVGILAASGGFSERCSMILMRRAGMCTEYVESLHALKVTDLSDEQGVQALLCGVIDEAFQYRGLSGDVEPFTFLAAGDLLSIQYTQNINRPDSFRRLTADYSAIFLALIPKIRRVEWQYQEIQPEGVVEEKHLRYDWAAMQEDGFIDSAICRIAEVFSAENFGAGPSALQFLFEHFSYEAKGKLTGKKSNSAMDREKMEQELKALPASYTEAAGHRGIYVEGVSLDISKDGYNREVWDAFCQKVKRGEEAAVIVGHYNSVENAAMDRAGSVYYSYIYFDREKYRVLEDFVGHDGSHDLEGEMIEGKYMLDSEWDSNGVQKTHYYITDDASVSWRDVMYSNLYSGINELTPADPVRADEVVAVFH